MAAVGAAGDGEKSGFRWLDLARYTVAAVVTVVIIAVVVHAIQVVFRPDSLALSVVGGSVSTTAFLSPPREPSLNFSSTLRGRNPSGRVRMYYFDISVYLFNSSTPATTRAPQADCFVSFQQQDMEVAQMESVDSLKLATVQRNPVFHTIAPSAFDALYKSGGSMKDVTMRVDGTLVTEISFGFNTTPRAVIYYCRQLVVGSSDDVDTMQTHSETSCLTS